MPLPLFEPFPRIWMLKSPSCGSLGQSNRVLFCNREISELLEIELLSSLGEGDTDELLLLLPLAEFFKALIRDFEDLV